MAALLESGDFFVYIRYSKVTYFFIQSGIGLNGDHSVQDVFWEFGAWSRKYKHSVDL